jgi:hypothetical protein
MDWGTVVLHAPVTWLDGVRRVPAGALVLRRLLTDRWTVAESADPERTWRLVAWWSPFTLALVVPPGGIAADVDTSRELADDVLAARLVRCARALPGLRVLGASVLLGIVIGIPAAVARFDSWGFAAGVAGVLLLALATAVAASYVVRRLGHPWRRATRIAAPLLWPFSAPRAAELVLEHAIAGASPLMVARRLLGAATFASWIRPQAYDALRDEASARERASGLLTLLGRSALTAIVQTPPSDCEPDERYCARCARVYRAGTATCAHCHAVALLRVAQASTTAIGGSG